MIGCLRVSLWSSKVRENCLLNTNEVRARAAAFAEEWKDAAYEKGETQSFYNEFFEVFGVRRRQVARFEEPVRMLENRGFLDLFWKGVLLVEQKSAGRDLKKAKSQAFDYFPGLKEKELPRYLLVSDFQTFELYDLEEGAELKFRLSELPKYVEAFDFIRGREKRTYREQDPVNIEAAELLGKLHDSLEASGYLGHDLERFLVRLVFCLFADDTGIFEPRDIFQDFVLNRTNEDGSDTGAWLGQLFSVLNRPEAARAKTLDEDLARFPYVNGELFAERLDMPSFDSGMRRVLLESCEFNWQAISPAIFGALFQSVMDKEERRQKGAHYTTERNILKVIEPLFLEGLRAEFTQLKARRDTQRRKQLEEFQKRLAALRFFDPACGCGNFLIIAYRELRRLEMEVLKEIHRGESQLHLDISGLSKIDVDQFYGIELEEFSARIAEVALWMMDHILNNELSLAFGKAYARIPLKKAPHIRHADALEIDWSDVLPANECSFLFGNPPFGGAKYQTDPQRAQVRRIAQLGGSGGTLDYVSAWFLRAGEYLKQGRAPIGFVATNSITQGEQVAQLWPLLFERFGLEIAFAHRTFAWGSDARGKAHVHVVIIGLTRRDQEPPLKRLFSYENINGDPVESTHKSLSPYLFDVSGLLDRHLVIDEVALPLNGAPKVIIGTKPIDGGHYIFDREARDEFLQREPRAAPYLHPFVGSKEFLNGDERWLLVVDQIPVTQARSMTAVTERVEAVKKMRENSKSAPTRELAKTPTRFHVTVIPKAPFLVIPEVSSERREYVPIAWLQPPTIPSNLVRVVAGADLWHFGILTSRMHMAWLRHIGGRLKSDYRYSIGMVYNTFPWPAATDALKDKVRSLAQKVLAARSQFPGASLADLYDSTLMKPVLRKAHRDLDVAVDRLYRNAAFASDRERVEHLFGLYEAMVTPLTARKSRRKRRSNS